MNSVNLLPPAAVQKFESQRARRVWTRIFVVLLLLASGAILWGQTVVARQNEGIVTEQRAATQPRLLQRQLQTLRNQKRQLASYESQQVAQRTHHSPLTLLALLQQIQLNLGGKFEVESIDLNNLTSGSANQQTARGGHVLLGCIAEDTVSTSAVMQQLRASQLFEEVQLTSALEKLEPTKPDLRFTVRCDY